MSYHQARPADSTMKGTVVSRSPTVSRQPAPETPGQGFRARWWILTAAAITAIGGALVALGIHGNITLYW